MLGLLTKLSEQEKIITSSKQQLCKLRAENLNLKSRISKLEEKLSSVDESLENSSNYVQDQKQSQRHPTSTHLSLKAAWLLITKRRMSNHAIIILRPKIPLHLRF